MEQAQERADKEMADANAMQGQYEAAWAGAEATHAQGRQLLDSLTKVNILPLDESLAVVSHPQHMPMHATRGVPVTICKMEAGSAWCGWCSKRFVLHALHAVCVLVRQARARKAEATTKLEQLQRDIAELSSLSPDLVEEENEAARTLNEVALLSTSCHCK